MTEEDDFITHLMGFGLSEKEAQCYFYLLKYGPRTPSPLAKSLHTYREDVHRTLTVLIDKGMVRPSLDSPTLYTAVELETALESAVKMHEAELREMERRKRELEELAQRQRFRPSDDVTTFKIMKSLREVLTTVATCILAVEKEYFSVLPESAIIVANQFGMLPLNEELIKKGASVRILITSSSYKGISATREVIDTGVEVRDLGEETAIFAVWDRKLSLSGIHWELGNFRLDQPLTALFTDDAAYAQYLTSTFELLWQQAVPAEERIQELLKQGPPKG